ncbi:Hsp20/alpha crystallin family protein [Bacillus kwashiorkori]|uniref:Hsp20/alpha crystallin family protein n=1 Tax=Bacillus kwashiorkori TaxID=1522318 RepID=UPI00078519BA|nr:Hsp20/alpha crystallin family protein [Bacillus kwashiorkori]
MFPWNFFNSSKNGFNPFKNLSEQDFHKMMNGWMEQMFPDYLKSLIEKETELFKTEKQPTKKDKQSEKQSYRNLQEIVFETHDYVYIRIPFEKKEEVRNIKIFYNLNKCMIDHLDSFDGPYTITLPTIVKKKGAKAIYRDKILEITIPKNVDRQFNEIDISH